jgi:hypothetical protein
MTEGRWPSKNRCKFLSDWNLRQYYNNECDRIDYASVRLANTAKVGVKF